jgi:hypothetical protein
MAVRCKFRVTSKEVYPKGDQCDRPTTVKLHAVKSDPFGKYTPSGHIEMYIMNDEAEAQFEVGEEYIVDFTKVEKEE